MYLSGNNNRPQLGALVSVFQPREDFADSGRQERIGADLAAALTRYQQGQAAGLTAELIDNAKMEILKIGTDYYNLSRDPLYNTDRNRRGGDYILSLARQIAADIEKDRARLATVTTAPTLTPGGTVLESYGIPVIGGGTVATASPAMAAGGGGGYFLPAGPAAAPVAAPSAGFDLEGWAPYILGAIGVGLLLRNRGR